MVLKERSKILVLFIELFVVEKKIFGAHGMIWMITNEEGPCSPRSEDCTSEPSLVPSMPAGTSCAALTGKMVKKVKWEGVD